MWSSTSFNFHDGAVHHRAPVIALDFCGTQQNLQFIAYPIVQVPAHTSQGLVADPALGRADREEDDSVQNADGERCNRSRFPRLDVAEEGENNRHDQ